MLIDTTLERNGDMHGPAKAVLAGHMLLSAREAHDLSAAQVAAMTVSIAETLGPEFAVHMSNLTDIESGLVTPTVSVLASLCAIYQLEMPQVLKWYGMRVPKPYFPVIDPSLPRSFSLETLALPRFANAMLSRSHHTQLAFLSSPGVSGFSPPPARNWIAPARKGGTRELSDAFLLMPPN